MFENLIETLQEWGEIIAQQYKDTLNNEGITASGKLVDSVRSVFSHNGTVYEVSLSLEDYWKSIEYGRPPTQNSGNGELRRAILKWIDVKPVIKRPYNGKLPTDEQLAYLISRKIHTLGYEGRHPLKRTIDELRADILKDIEEAIQKDLNKEVLIVLHTIDGK